MELYEREAALENELMLEFDGKKYLDLLTEFEGEVQYHSAFFKTNKVFEEVSLNSEFRDVKSYKALFLYQALFLA
jgi:hypothetical protein